MNVVTSLHISKRLSLCSVAIAANSGPFGMTSGLRYGLILAETVNGTYRIRACHNESELNRARFLACVFLFDEFSGVGVSPSSVGRILRVILRIRTEIEP